MVSTCLENGDLYSFGITEVEMRAVKESAERVNGKEVYLIHEPMAAAIGIGLRYYAAQRKYDCGYRRGTTEIAVIALGGIVCDKSVKIAGDVLPMILFTICEHSTIYMLGKATAENIKITIGSATEDLQSPPDEMSVQGRDLLTGKTKTGLFLLGKLPKPWINQY